MLVGIIFSLIIDEGAKSLKKRLFVIPVKTGIHSFQVVGYAMDTRLRGYDDFLRDHHSLGYYAF